MSSDVTYENNCLTVERTFAAPAEAVFDAWIQTSKVQLWWGCADAVSVRSEIEACVGGKFYHDMKIRNVGDHKHYGRIVEFDPPRLLVYELDDPFHTDPMLIRVVFVPQNGSTRVTLTQAPLPPTYSEFVKTGWAEGFEKLHRQLTSSFAGV